MKRIWMGLALCALLTGCAPEEAPVTDAGPSRDELRARVQKDRYNIAVIPKGLVHQFWLTVRAGAEAAAKDHGGAVMWRGPEAETDVVKQVNIVDDMITRGVDGIVLAACDQKALIEPIQRAINAGIPVVTIDSGVDSDLPVSFVATDNVKGAQMAADELARLINGTGEVGLIPFVPGAATSEMREQGFKEGIAKYPDIKLVATQYCMSDVGKAMSVTQDIMTANPNLAGIFAANEPAAMGAAQAIESANRAGQIKVVAFDAAEEEQAALRRGTLQALIVQNPYEIGYQGVKAVLDHIKGQDVPKRIDTGVTVVTPENIDTPEIQKLLNPTAPAAKPSTAAPAPATQSP